MGQSRRFRHDSEQMGGGGGGEAQCGMATDWFVFITDTNNYYSNDVFIDGISTCSNILLV